MSLRRIAAVGSKGLGTWAVAIAAGLAFLLAAGCARPGEGARWVATWVAAPQLTEPHNLPPEPGFDDSTLRQTIRVSLGGSRVRVRFSNAFGNDALRLESARLAFAVAPGQSGIRPGTDRALTFHGETSVRIPRGALMISDPLDLELTAFADLAVSVHLQGAPSDVTGHPGSRTTSYLQSGNATSAESLPEAARTDHWYFLSGVDVWTDASRGAVAIIGDSITDGRGSTTNGNDRWPDQLARRLASDPRTAGIAVLNQGIGGNRVLGDGLGPSALARLDRDVIAQAGVRWLVVYEGINDLGTAAGARARGEPAATARDLIAAYDQIILRAHAHGIRVYGATILPYEGASYFSAQGEEDRQEVNRWIRTSGRYDGVIDFDAATRDPDNPSRLARAVDVGDRLHLNPDGYRVMAEAVDLELFVD